MKNLLFVIGGGMALILTERVALHVAGLPRDSLSVFGAMFVAFWIGGFIGATSREGGRQ